MTVAAAIAAGELADCLWLYSNYHCNLSCGYCLTDSSPKAGRRALGAERMVALARQAAELGFARVGVTGGEPFLVPDMPETLAQLAAVLPVVVLTNATLFTDRLLDRLRPLAALPVTLQVSLDSADPHVNDAQRGAGNFDTVVAALPRLLALGLRVRIATTGADDPELCALHRALGISDDDHIVRPIVRRGRAIDRDLGVPATATTLPPELTVTADGAFASPFAATVYGGAPDTDLLLMRAITPLRRPADALLGMLRARPPGADAALGIR